MSGSFKPTRTMAANARNGRALREKFDRGGSEDAKTIAHLVVPTTENIGADLAGQKTDR